MAAHTAKPTRALVDVQSGAVRASTSPVAVDAESWALLLWQVLHLCQQIQARLDHRVERLEQQGPVVARQAAWLAAGKGLRYLSGELHRRL